ncbi:MAG TPA: hypothetical protein VGR28_11785 [Candidatus Thermoplasmatota archaeon]|nr:hypothetical protein [Candidatus Thermoplasmatota archaeon]
MKHVIEQLATRERPARTRCGNEHGQRVGLRGRKCYVVGQVVGMGRLCKNCASWKRQAVPA